MGDLTGGVVACLRSDQVGECLTGRWGRHGDRSGKGVHGCGVPEHLPARPSHRRDGCLHVFSCRGKQHRLSWWCPRDGRGSCNRGGEGLRDCREIRVASLHRFRGGSSSFRYRGSAFAQFCAAVLGGSRQFGRGVTAGAVPGLAYLGDRASGQSHGVVDESGRLIEDADGIDARKSACAETLPEFDQGREQIFDSGECRYRYAGEHRFDHIVRQYRGRSATVKEFDDGRRVVFGAHAVAPVDPAAAVRSVAIA